jgi:hypothetical protein
MGVMLSLDRERPAKGRRRQGQHVRDPRDAERARPVEAARRCEATASGRLLARLARAVLARKDESSGESVRGGSAPAA